METYTLESLEEKRLTDEEVFSQIWLNPRKVFKFINFYHYDKYMMMLLVLAGITNAFQQNPGINISHVGTIIVNGIIGAIVGLIGNYIFATLISWTGEWLNGKANTKDVLKVLAYSSVPLIFTLVLVVARFILRGDGDFGDDLEGHNSLTQYIETGLLFASTALATWTFIICIVGLAEVQKFSIVKALLNFILPFLIFAVPIVLIVFLLKFGN